jgi:hypothetical protein
MLDPETDEQRIKRLEATVDALTYLLKRTNEQLLNLAADKAKSQGIPIDSEPFCRDILNTFHTIKELKPCYRKRNDWH